MNILKILRMNPAPEYVYTPSKNINNSKFLACIITSICKFSV